MAHAATIGQLAEGLVRSIVSADNERIPYAQLRDNASRTFRKSGHARTNQFDVQSRLVGLEEKFSVRNREDLSERMQSCLEELPIESKWLPEILQLLLSLSDNPLEQIRAVDTETVVPAVQDKDHFLTWQELAAEDSSYDDEIWNDIEHGYHSSGDEGPAVDRSDDSISTLATSIGDIDVVQLAESELLHADGDALNDVQEYFDSFRRDDCGTISELTLVRETLSMLHGLPTHLYHYNPTTGEVLATEDVQCSTLTRPTLRGVMGGLAATASALNILRRWTSSYIATSYLQSCQAAARQLLSQYAQFLATHERKYIAGQQPRTVVSILSLQAEVRRTSAGLLHLAQIVLDSLRPKVTSPFALLDALFDRVCEAELSGDKSGNSTILPVFIAGVRTYLRSMSSWVCHGLCRDPGPTSLVVDANSECGLHELWWERYSMRRFDDGHPGTPMFMRALAPRLFAHGKSMAFLRLLRNDTSEQAPPGSSALDLSSFEARDPDLILLPFSQRVEDFFESWYDEIAADSKSSLPNEIRLSHGLIQTLHDLTYIFCSRDGTAFQTFADGLFWSFDHNTSTRKNSFILTELAQTSLRPTGSDKSIASHLGDTDTIQSSIKHMGAVRLETTFTWPIQNITRTASPTTYSKIFAFLLQIYRAKYLLQQPLYDLRALATSRLLMGDELRICFRLRQQCLAVVDILHAHVTTTAISCSNQMILEMEAAQDMDSMADVWARHEKQLEVGVLLSEKLKPLHDALLSHLELCERFLDAWWEIRVARSGEEHGVENVESSMSAFSRLAEEGSRSLAFITAGLRSVSRAAGNVALQILAERLEWIIDR